MNMANVWISDFGDFVIPDEVMKKVTAKNVVRHESMAPGAPRFYEREEPAARPCNPEFWDFIESECARLKDEFMKADK